MSSKVQVMLSLKPESIVRIDHYVRRCNEHPLKYLMTRSMAVEFLCQLALDEMEKHRPPKRTGFSIAATEPDA